MVVRGSAVDRIELSSRLVDMDINNGLGLQLVLRIAG